MPVTVLYSASIKLKRRENAMSDTGVTVKKNQDFSEWYVEVILKAGLADYAPVKGCMIIRQDAYAVWEKIQEILNKKIKATGHRNVYFPMFIPEAFLKKEAEHFAGFTPEVAWITMGGETPLKRNWRFGQPAKPSCMTPLTSGFVAGATCQLKLINGATWLGGKLKLQNCFCAQESFFGKKATRHTLPAEEAEAEVMYALGEYKDIMENYLAIPVLIGTKSDSEKFAGALYTTALESIMPDGKALQMGTSHNLGQHFAKVFDIKYIGEDKQDHYVWQTSWGITTRLIGAMIMVHGDDKGLIMPPKVAPTQVVIVPIPFKDLEAEAIAAKTKEIAKTLKEKGISVILDDSGEYTPGWKFNEWELKGVPVRIELGPRDLKQGQVVMVRRDTGQKTPVKEADISTLLRKLLVEIQDNLFAKAKAILEEKITTVQTYDEFKSVHL